MDTLNTFKEDIENSKKIDDAIIQRIRTYCLQNKCSPNENKLMLNDIQELVFDTAEILDLTIPLIFNNCSFTGCHAPRKTFWGVQASQNVLGGVTIILMPRPSPSESYNFV